MIEKIISYNDLLALLLGIALSGLFIFLFYLFGSILGDDQDVKTNLFSLWSGN